MPFLPLFTGIRLLAHVLTVPPAKVCLLCATPAGLDLYIQACPKALTECSPLDFRRSSIHNSPTATSASCVVFMILVTVVVMVSVTVVVMILVTVVVVISVTVVVMISVTVVLSSQILCS